MVLGGIRWKGVDWLHLAQDRDQRWNLANTVMNLRVAITEGGYVN
jgi:hypothetical protein